MSLYTSKQLQSHLVCIQHKNTIINSTIFFNHQFTICSRLQDINKYKILNWKMFFRGKVEICVHLEKLNNIFIRQGAQIKIKMGISHQDPHFGLIKAKPVQIRSSHMIPSSLTNQSYLSRPIRIYSSVDDATINDTILWTTFIDAFQKIPQLKLTCQLMICKAGQDLHLKTVNFLINILASTFLPIYFDQFGFVSSIEGDIHTAISEFSFHNNQQEVTQLVNRLQLEKKQQHIMQNKINIIPPIIKSFSEFIIKMMNDSKYQSDILFDRFHQYLLNTTAYLSKSISNLEKSRNNKMDFSCNLYASRNALTERRDKKKIFQLSMSKVDYQRTATKDSFTSLQTASIKVSSIWQQFVQLLSRPHQEYILLLRKQYFSELFEYYSSKKIIFQPIPSSNNIIPSIRQIQTNNYKIAINNFQSKRSDRVYTHLVIFVHGINAHSFDMESLRNMMKFINPTVQLYLSRTNQERTDDKIAEQGQRLSLEIKNLIRTKYYNIKNLKISMLCHSMGGLIARASLEYLQYFQENLHCFITLCSPHLGQLLHPSTFIKTTIFLINKFSPSSSMLELNMQDSVPEQSYIYKLSQSAGLSWFKHVILVNVLEDNIVPRCSARIEQADESMINMPEYRLFHKMIYNINKNLNPGRVTKIQFKGAGSSDFDSFIGKSQHIQLIKDVEAIRILNMILYNLF